MTRHTIDTVILSVANVECIYKLFMPSVIMLNAVILSVVAPKLLIAKMLVNILKI